MIEGNASNEELLSNVLINPPVLDHNNIFLMYTKDLIEKFPAIYSIGQWDNNEKRLGPRTGYQPLNCNRYRDNELFCQEGVIDLGTGFTHKGNPLRETIIIDGGYVKRTISYPNDQGQYLQILNNGSELMGVQLIDSEIYRSNFNQMFLLGKYDGTLFKQYYNAFPWTRVFHVKVQNE